MQKPKPSSTAFRSLTLQAVMLAITLFASLGMAQADYIPAITFSSYSDSNATSDSTRGYNFDVTAPVYVAGLSIFDAGGNGLAESHEVGLWNSAGTLLASVLIDSGTTNSLDSSGKFRYMLLNSVLSLAVDTGYRVGGFFLNESLDIQAFNIPSIATATGISFMGGASVENSILAFPSDDLTFPNIRSLPGGSLLLTDSPVPEPATLPLLAAGVLFGLAGRRVTKRRQHTTSGG